MTQDFSMENLVVHYLVNHQYLVTQTPLSLAYLLTLIALDNKQVQATPQQLTALERCCTELSTYLPSALIVKNSHIEYIDIEVLVAWLIGPTEEEKEAKSSDPVQREDKGLANTVMDLIEGNNSYLNQLHSEITTLIGTDSAQTILARERAIAKPAKPYTPVCSSSSRQDCLSKGQLSCLKAIHFEQIITSNTDSSIGNCSYLDTCYKGKGCKYVHYRIVYPDHKTPSPSDLAPDVNPYFYGTGERMSDAVYSEMPAQYISCDIRKLDLSLLGEFAAIVADPPWDIHMNGNMQMPLGVITDDEMMSFRIDQVQSEGVFFLWVTGRALDIGRQCLKKWGYDKIEELVWCKTNQLGRTICTGRTGHWLNHSKEHCLMGIKGNPAWLNKGLDVDTIVSATREKSRKPDELYDIIERLVGPTARKLELFGREHNIRPQWLTVGIELDGTRLIEPDVANRFHNWHVANG